jgi:hypothetical protein
VTSYPLVAHGGAAAPAAVRGVVASVGLEPGRGVVLEYRLTADLARLAIPRRSQARRADRLWEHTCFEAFVAPASGTRYYELNFSPSTEWAAYEFDGYRQGMRPFELSVAPSVVAAETAGELSVTAAIELDALLHAPWPWRIGLTAVVEDRAGTRAYFALHHPRQNPDFHDVAGFTALLDGSAR